MEIVAQCVIDRILNEIRLGQYFGLIMDETPDKSKTEQISVCLRYIFHCATKSP